jgi:hypothetical protein
MAGWAGVQQMTTIRPLGRSDLPQVTSLYERVMRSGSDTPPPRLGAYFERTLFDHPWADPEIPSLVYETSDGTVGGFIASHVRRLRFDGKPIRVGYSGQLVSDPVVRSRGVGALLLRSYMAGPQDATITDGATVEVRRIWERLGGAAALLGSLSWTRFFRPSRFAVDLLLQRLGRTHWKPVARPLCAPVDGVAGRYLRVDEPATWAEELTPGMLLEHLPTVTDHLRVRPDYDEAFLTWLFAEMARVTSRGHLTGRLVHDREGRTLGWYVAYLQPGGVGQVLQVAARTRNVDAVVDHLFHHAWRMGVTALRGRLERVLFETVWQRRCYLRHSERVLVHSQDASLVGAITAGDGLLTRMEGEWWMGHHLEPFA